MTPFIWHPIAMLPRNTMGSVDHGLNMLVHAPELVDLDCNPHGIAEGYWQDGGLGDPATEPGAFLVPKYCMCHDEWHTAEVTPTHFMFVTAPDDSPYVGDDERACATESWSKVDE